jgi:hypothetical protein
MPKKYVKIGYHKILFIFWKRILSDFFISKYNKNGNEKIAKIAKKTIFL